MSEHEQSSRQIPQTRLPRHILKMQFAKNQLLDSKYCEVILFLKIHE